MNLRTYKNQNFNQGTIFHFQITNHLARAAKTLFITMAFSRLRFLEEETLILEEKFRENPCPTAADYKLLADHFNGTADKIRIWFNNRRAKALRKPDLSKRQRSYINSRLASVLEEAYMRVSISDKQLTFLDVMVPKFSFVRFHFPFS